MNLKKAIKILNIRKLNSLEQLRTTYLNRAHEAHPDKNPEKDTTEDFRKVMEAYEFCLGHIDDLFKHYNIKEQPSAEEISKKTRVENLDDIFADIFGFSQSKTTIGYLEPQIIYLTLHELMTGVLKKQKMMAYRKCPDCRGIGAKSGHIARICTYCFGQGVIKKKKTEKNPRGCPRCFGRGRIVTDKCARCQGFGRLKQYHQQKFYIPVGLKPNEQFTIKSQDLITNKQTEICIEPRLYRDPIFQIDNYDLVCQYHVDFHSHNKDESLKLKTPIEEVPFVIGKKVKKGDVIRIQGKGLYKSNSKKDRGDLFINICSKKHSLFKRLWGGLFGKA
ncbi:MAG: DnaJ C-terminal domain-containing protein [bacterium]|nr:DnaJ domain-containing protein [bacterium]